MSPETKHTHAAHVHTLNAYELVRHTQTYTHRHTHMHTQSHWTETSDIPSTLLTEARRDSQMIFIWSWLSQAWASGKPTVMLKTCGRCLRKQSSLTVEIHRHRKCFMLYHSRKLRAASWAEGDDLLFVCQVHCVKSVCQLRPSDLKWWDKAKDVRNVRMALHTTLNLFYEFLFSHCTQHRVNKLDDGFWVTFFSPVNAFWGLVPALSPETDFSF